MLSAEKGPTMAGFKAVSQPGARKSSRSADEMR